MTPAKMFFLIVSTLALLIIVTCLNTNLVFVLASLIFMGFLACALLGILWQIAILLSEEFNKKWPQFQTK